MTCGYMPSKDVFWTVSFSAKNQRGRNRKLLNPLCFEPFITTLNLLSTRWHFSLGYTCIDWHSLVWLLIIYKTIQLTHFHFRRCCFRRYSWHKHICLPNLLMLPYQIFPRIAVIRNLTGYTRSHVSSLPVFVNDWYIHLFACGWSTRNET